MTPRGFILCLVLGLALLGNVAAALAAPANRQAIIIGNADYPAAGLRNPVNDAKSVSIAAQDIGFDVALVENAPLDEMRGAIRAAIEAAKDTEILMIYFAGHGVQVGGTNYLLPIDIDLTSSQSLEKRAIAVSDIVGWIADAGVPVSVIFLDACRNNPFRSDAVAASGLTLVESGSRELVISYAAASGAVAYDGAGPNSPYSSALVEAMATPDLDIYSMLRMVRARVRTSTEGRQIPWVSGSIEQSIVLHQGGPDSMLVVGGVEPPAADASGLDEVAWKTIMASSNADYFEEFVRTFPSSRYAATATDRVDDLRNLGKRSVSTNLGDVPILVVGGASEPLADKAFDAAIDNCDVLAASESDPLRMAPGVTMFALNADRAILACTNAIASHPNEARFQYQLARSLAAAERWSESIVYARKAAELGYAEGFSFLGWMNAGGLGMPANEAQALEMWKKASALGSPNARANLGRSYRDGFGLDASLPDAVYWLTLAATSGERVAADDLGNMYRKGVGVPANIDEAMRWYYLSSSLGGSNAMTTIANIYRDGDGIDANPALAESWYGRAIAGGNRFAPFQLARMRLKQAGNKATPEIIGMFVLAGDRGFAEGYLQASRLYAQDKKIKGGLERAYFYGLLAGEEGGEKAKAALADIRVKLKAERAQSIEREASLWLEQNGEFARKSQYAK